MDMELEKIKLESKMELAKMDAVSPAKEVAGKAIGRYGLTAIVIIVIIGVLASLWLDEGKMAAVMGLLGADKRQPITGLDEYRHDLTEE